MHPTSSKATDQSDEYKSVVATKLKLTKISKDKDKRKKKRDKKKEKKLKKEEELRYINEIKHRNKAGIEEAMKENQREGPERRRFENQSGRRNSKKTLSEHLTKQQMNQIEVRRNREVTELIKEAQFTYKMKQDKFNKQSQTITEVNEMPPLVMTKIM